MGEMLVLIQIGEETVALPASSVKEIVHVPTASRLPGQPSILHGFFNLRGRIVPIVCLRRMFYPHPEANVGVYSPVLIIRLGGEDVGFLADSVTEVLNVNQEELQPVSSNQSFNNCAEVCFYSSGGSIPVLSPERLLLRKEQECIAALRSHMEQRVADVEGAGG